MITPFYYHSKPSPLFPKETFGKWYCLTEEMSSNVRYMSPDGWKSTAHWYNTKEEAEDDFNKFESVKKQTEVLKLFMDEARNIELELENIQLKAQIAALTAKNEKLEKITKIYDRGWRKLHDMIPADLK